MQTMCESSVSRPGEEQVGVSHDALLDGNTQTMEIANDVMTCVSRTTIWRT
jgi:hypothetical protein